MNKISVVLPVAAYNREWLDTSIASTAGVADELIIVADEGCEFDPRFYNNPLIHKVVVVKSPGLVPALNAGISIAAGPYISFLCSDDHYLTPGAEEVANFVRNTPIKYDIIGAQSMTGGIIGHSIWPPNGDISSLETVCCITSPAFYLKDRWWQVHGYEDFRYPDWYFWKKMIKVGAGYHFIPKVIYYYHAWPGTISASYNYNSSLGHKW
jgi:glycosyltransferase involved in cell wall biosynthesis